AFPVPPAALHDVTVDPESGTLYASDMGNAEQAPAIFRVNPKGKVTVVTDPKRWPDLKRPTALVLDGASHLLVADAADGSLHRVRLANGTAEKIADGLGQPTGLTWDRHGRLYVSD